MENANAEIVVKTEEGDVKILKGGHLFGVQNGQTMTREKFDQLLPAGKICCWNPGEKMLSNSGISRF